MPAGIRAPSRLAFALLILAGFAAWDDALADGADLFAPSRETGQAMDAARALPAPAFYDASLDGAAAGSLVRAEASDAQP